MTALEARGLLGFSKNEDHITRYSLWCTEVQAFIISNGVENQMQAGSEKWVRVQEWAMEYRLTQGTSLPGAEMMQLPQG